MDWADLLYKNNKFNEIQIISDGIGDQTGTKVDVRVIIDGKPTEINVSLKADDVKQFGQVGGSSFNAQVSLWSQLFKADVTNSDINYYAMIQKKDTIGAIREVYAYAADRFNGSFLSNKKKTLKDLSAGIKHFATLNEENVTLVQLSKGEAQVYEFDNLETLLKNSKLRAVLITSKATPEIQIIDDNGDILVSVRIKTENKPNGIYIRNYIEKGHLLTKLASYVAA
jgi:hypothetical protein